MPLVDPVLTKTIGIITSARTQRSPVVEELLVLFAPLELDEAVAGPSYGLDGRRPIEPVRLGGHHRRRRLGATAGRRWRRTP